VTLTGWAQALSSASRQRPAPQLRDFDLMAPHKYAAVKDPVVARKLLKAIHPAL
jgi:hypothetical protein